MIFYKLLERAKRLHSGYNNEVLYREVAMERILAMARFNHDLSIRVFQSSLMRATELAHDCDGLILFYIEESLPDGVIPSMGTLEIRRSLADEHLGDYINQEFIFMTCTPDHPYAKMVTHILQTQDSSKALLHVEYPLLVVLSPQLHNDDDGQYPRDQWQAVSVNLSTSSSSKSSGMLSSREGRLPSSKVSDWVKKSQPPLMVVASLRGNAAPVTVASLRQFLSAAKEDARAMASSSGLSMEDATQRVDVSFSQAEMCDEERPRNEQVIEKVDDNK
eukprot:gene4432-4856_t